MGLKYKFIAEMILAQQDALEGVFSFVKQDRPLSSSFIRELHSTLVRPQPFVEGRDRDRNTTQTPLLRGEWKRIPNNPLTLDGSIHEYCSPEFVQDEIDRLIEMHLSHREVLPEIEAAWLHHRFTQIHPFQDGNGRVARSLASMVSIRAGLLPVLIRRQIEQLISMRWNLRIMVN